MKRIFLLFLVFVTAVTLKAQFIKNYGVKFGIATSQQFTRFHIPENTIGLIVTSGPVNSLQGMTIGVNTEFMDYPPFNLVFEGNYIQKGYSYEWTEDWTGVNKTYIEKFRFHYLNFLLLTKTKIVYEKISPYILAGPRLDIEIAYEDSRYAEYNNKFIPGFVVGIGSEIALYNIKFLAEVIYDFNFGKIHEDTYETVSYQSYVFRLGILL